MSATWRFRLNGAEVAVDADPMARLLDVVRERCGLTGAKEGCGEGECGSCTVVLDGEPVCSCLVPVLQVEGRDVRTVESLDEDDPMVRSIVSAGGVQCGACTPGIALTLRALLDRDAQPGRDRVRTALAGNLCRCTGYERILRAVEEATS